MKNEFDVVEVEKVKKQHMQQYILDEKKKGNKARTINTKIKMYRLIFKYAVKENREIIGHSCGPNKDAPLVKSAFQTISHPLTEVKIFHTDRGKEFDNKLIDTILETFDIERSLNKKGCPYDNAVAESTCKSFKVEFVYPNIFETLNQLKLQLFDYVNW